MAIGSGTSARNIGIWGYSTAENAGIRGQSMLDDYLGRSLSALGQGRTDLRENYLGAIDRLNPWVSAGTSALGTYQGSLGLGGDAARDDAVAKFRASPGYEYKVAQGTDAVARKASALGALGSGNTMTAIADYNRNEADQDYGNWQSQLQGLSDRGQQAATAQSSLQGQLGSSLASLGATEAGLYGGYGQMGLNNLWNATNTGIGAVLGQSKQATDNVNSGASLWANVLGSGVNLLTGLYGNGGKK
ncbi:conserved hypothetical protein [Hyphomicrobiales bacterium]|nr:conserved hypothetical protein [Hyphomicrobiales bacterium]CAH1697266.1 conserved hypothetical protein [Hyphomicrobiales bacterium]CAI0342833.1 conserved hypothetical protein [Hyphomicrobiales bacterium]